MFPLHSTLLTKPLPTLTIEGIINISLIGATLIFKTLIFKEIVCQTVTTILINLSPELKFVHDVRNVAIRPQTVLDEHRTNLLRPITIFSRKLPTIPLCQGKTGVKSSSQTLNSTPTAAHMSNEIATDNTFSIKGYLENTSYDFLIDTGASITAIHISVWEILRPQGRTLKSAGFETFQTAGGTPLEVLGSFTCLFNIDGSLYPFQTNVMKNLSYNVIIG